MIERPYQQTRSAALFFRQDPFFTLVDWLARRDRPPQSPPAVWSEILALAQVHGLEGALYHLVRAYHPLAPAYASLESTWREQRRHTQKQLNALLHLEADMNALNIPVVRLLSCSLVPRFYEDMGEREVTELDILIEDGQRPAVRAWQQEHPHVLIKVHTKLSWKKRILLEKNAS